MDRFDLGKHTRPISTSSSEARRWFNIGLNWCYGFNHEEGVQCFLKALEHDPECVMAHWGAAYGSGPFYNNVWRQFSEAEANEAAKLAYNHIQRARSFAHTASSLENQLVDALAQRFQEPHCVTGEIFDQGDDDYANAMRDAYQSNKDDDDITALFCRGDDDAHGMETLGHKNWIARPKVRRS